MNKEEDPLEFANPKAPSHVKTPQFALPSSRKTVADRSLTMTPRAVVASTRAFSSVVYYSVLEMVFVTSDGG